MERVKKTGEGKMFVAPAEYCERRTTISGKEILERAGRIKPVLRFENVGIDLVRKDYNNYDAKSPLYYLEATDVFNGWFTWDPKPTMLAEEELHKLGDIITHHPPGAATVGATQAQVLAQIPSRLLGKVVAYETKPLTIGNIGGISATDSNPDGCVSMHTVLYTDHKTIQQMFKKLHRKMLRMG